MVAQTEPRLVRFTPVELVEAVRDGRIRYPRPTHPSAAEVAALLDAVHRRYPQRPPLLWHDPGDAVEDFWLLDGGALISALLRAYEVGSEQSSPEPVWFDTDLGEVVAWRQRPDPRHVMLRVQPMLTAPDLDGYLGAEELHGVRAERVRAFVGAMREHVIPAQVVELPRSDLPRLFRHLPLRSGVLLSDIQPLPAPRAAPPLTSEPSRSWRQRLSRSAMGALGRSVPEAVRWRALLVAEGLDPELRYDRESADALPDDGRPAVRAVRQAQAFLREFVGYPEGPLLPETGTLPVVARFLRVFPDLDQPLWPLLSRWVWRTALGGADPDDRPQALAIIAGDAARSAVRLLETTAVPELVPPGREAVDPDTRDGRLVLLGVASLHPRDLAAGTLVDVERLVAPRRIIPTAGPEVANLILQDSWWEGAFRDTRHAVEAARPDLLASHGIDDVAVGLLRDGADEEFLVRRASALDRVVVDFWTRTTEPTARTRRPIASLFEDDDGR